MTAKPQAENHVIPKKIDFYTALRKARRELTWEPGNRTQFVAVKTYFAMIQHNWRQAEALCEMLEKVGRPGDAKHIWRRTQRVVEQRRRTCNHNAIRLLARRPDAADWTLTDARILAAMMLHGWQTGLCSAGQRAIGQAAGYSRETANRTIKRLEAAGMIERVSYDKRGEYQWRRSTYNRWCIVFTVPLVGISKRRPPTPVSKRYSRRIFMRAPHLRAGNIQWPPPQPPGRRHSTLWDSVASEPDLKKAVALSRKIRAQMRQDLLKNLSEYRLKNPP